MNGEGVSGTDLQIKLIEINRARKEQDKAPLQQRDIARLLSVTQGSISHALNDYDSMDDLRRRIAELFISLEKGDKPLPNRMYSKPLVTR